jgi:mannose-1-phosphate guanylyltransferase
MTDAARSWAIILAGGEGRRLKDFVRTVHGDERPKQFATFIGKRSMLRHTLDRVRLVIPTHHILTIIDQSQVQYIHGDLCDQPEGTLIVQPCRRETGAGILLPLLSVYKRDPNAHVAIFPSDHFILEEVRFMGYIESAFLHVNRFPHHVITLGIFPEYADATYGWIEKGEKIASHQNKTVYRVRNFVEKPSIEIVGHLHDSGYLWNSMVLVGSVATFLRQFQVLLPDLYDAFVILQSALGTSEEAATLHRVFEKIPSINFSLAFLERIKKDFYVFEVGDVYWSDWGDEYRIRRDVERLGLKLLSR